MYRQMLLGDSSITIRREWNELRRRMARSFTGLTSLIHRLEAPLRRWLAEDRCTESTELSPPPPALLVLPETERIRTETTAPGPPPMKGAGIPQAPEPTSDVRLARNDTQVTTPDGQEGPGSSDGAEELSERPTVIARDEPETTAPVPPPRKRSLLPPPPGLDERPTISGTWPSGLQPSARRWARWMLWTGIACATLVLASMASVTLGDDLWYIVLRESRRPGNEAPATQAPSLPSAPSPAPTPSSRSSGTPVDAPVQGRSTVPFPP